MQSKCVAVVFSLLFVGILLSAPPMTAAEEKPTAISLGDGKLTLTLPAQWTKVQPKSRIIEYEFSVKSAAGDAQTGRVTIMGAGGSVDDNIKRWLDQFSQPDASDTKDKAKIEKKSIANCEVHFVDIPGTYKDAPAGPFAGGKTVERPDYRMLAAIILTKSAGSYFVKFYGPAKTVAENEKSFKEMLESMKEK